MKEITHDNSVRDIKILRAAMHREIDEYLDTLEEMVGVRTGKRWIAELMPHTVQYKKQAKLNAKKAKTLETNNPPRMTKTSLRLQKQHDKETGNV